MQLDRSDRRRRQNLKRSRRWKKIVRKFKGSEFVSVCIDEGNSEIQILLVGYHNPRWLYRWNCWSRVTITTPTKRNRLRIRGRAGKHFLNRMVQVITTSSLSPPDANRKINEQRHAKCHFRYSRNDLSFSHRLAIGKTSGISIGILANTYEFVNNQCAAK